MYTDIDGISDKWVHIICHWGVNETIWEALIGERSTQPPFVVNLEESMETPLTLNNAHIREFIKKVSKVCSRSKTLWCYIETAAVE